MPKSPAINWYFDNWGGGTKTMSRFLKGCYMDLLDAQFQDGHLSLDEIKHVLGADFSAWQTLKKKFDQDVHGNYFNERLDIEIKKRDESSKKQSERVKKRWEKYRGINHGITAVIPVNDTESESNNKVGNENEKIIEPPKTEIIQMDDYLKYPVDDLCKSYITGSEYQGVREAICFKNRVKMEQVIARAKEFTMHLKSTGELKKTMRDYMTHFSNWMNHRPKDDPKPTGEPKRKTAAELLKEQGY